MFIEFKRKPEFVTIIHDHTEGFRFLYVSYIYDRQIRSREKVIERLQIFIEHIDSGQDSYDLPVYKLYFDASSAVFTMSIKDIIAIDIDGPVIISKFYKRFLV